MLNYLVPKDVQTIVSGNISQCHNLSLILGRYIPRQAIERLDVPGEQFKKWHEVWMKRTVAGLKLPSELVIAQHGRWQAKTGDAARFERRLASRMIIGLGGKGPLEIGITLDYITGLPVIPGSALKGLARTYAVYSIAEAFGVPVLTEPAATAYQERAGKDKHRATPLEYLDEWLAAPETEKNGARDRASVMSDLRIAAADAIDCGAPAMKLFAEADLEASNEAVLFRLVFGSNAQSGLAVFHEAVVSAASSDSNLFEVDVMTPHFKDYYNSGNDSKGKPSKPPADNDGPNPINFITVAEGTVFDFAVAVRSRSAAARSVREDFYRLIGPKVDGLTDDQLFSEIRTMARTWLQRAVNSFGVGGKTAAGYGYFTKVKD